MTQTTIPTAVSVDFFISYSKADEAWARWIDWQVTAQGYSTIVQAWDFAPGDNFVVAIDSALKVCKRIILVLSPDYLQSVWCRTEWSAALADDPVGIQKKLLPVMVRDCEPDGLLRPIVYVSFLRKDPTGIVTRLSETESRDALLGSLAAARTRPPAPPSFPGGSP
jgi:hypothetical protein